jgi:hypothetical protein
MQGFRPQNCLFAGLSYGHGWFRTSDLSRVKRYVTPRENARIACKSGHFPGRAKTAISRSLRSFTGSSGSWASSTAHTTGAAELARGATVFMLRSEPGARPELSASAAAHRSREVTGGSGSREAARRRCAPQPTRQRQKARGPCRNHERTRKRETRTLARLAYDSPGARRGGCCLRDRRRVGEAQDSRLRRVQTSLTPGPRVPDRGQSRP